jgi:MoaA/NifB/PqqE/SkfB family radical SAM enzyme
MQGDRQMKKRDTGHNEGMEIKIGDKSLMMIFLLEECNFSCDHCVREDEPMHPGYKLSFEQLKMCLSDCHSLQSIEWVHFSGGEPTLWTDGKRDMVDLLIEISRAGFEPGFITNGSNFMITANVTSFFRNILTPQISHYVFISALILFIITLMLKREGQKAWIMS